MFNKILEYVIDTNGVFGHKKNNVGIYLIFTTSDSRTMDFVGKERYCLFLFVIE